MNWTVGERAQSKHNPLFFCKVIKILETVVVMESESPPLVRLCDAKDDWNEHWKKVA